MESWMGRKWAWYRFSKRKTAHWYACLFNFNSHFVVALCGDTAAIDLLEPEETAKTLCKKCLKIKGKKP